MKLAAIQMTSTADLEANLRQASMLLDEAARQGARLALLPENFACYGGDYRGIALTHGERLCAWLAQQARSRGLWLIGGTLPLAERPDGAPVPAPRVRAACLVHDPAGVRVARYDKLHLFDVEVADAQRHYRESAVFEPGDRIAVVDCGGVRVGLAVCYDLRFPLLAASLRQQGAELLVYPSAFTRVTGAAHWAPLLRARAIENASYVLAAGQCGQHNETRFSHGHSLLADPWGEVIATLGDTPGVLVAEFDRCHLERVRKQIPVHSHQRFHAELPDDISGN